MTARSIARAVVHEIVPPRHVRAWLIEAAIPTADDIEHVRQAVLILLAALAILAAVSSCTR